MQYRNGKINSTGAAVSLSLGFVPDKFVVTNFTNSTDLTGVSQAVWIRNFSANGSALLETLTAGVAAYSNLASNGITPVNFGGNWQNTIYTITGISNANPGVVTVNPVNPANSMVLANGMTVTISGVNGMSGLNTNRFVVTAISGSTGSQTFVLYDTFGNPVDTTSLGTYVSGGELDVISYPPTAPVLDPVTGQVLIPAKPAGLQLDTGFAGVTLGTGVVGANTDVLFWEAFYSTPTGW